MSKEKIVKSSKKEITEENAPNDDQIVTDRKFNLQEAMKLINPAGEFNSFINPSTVGLLSTPLSNLVFAGLQPALYDPIMNKRLDLNDKILELREG